MVIILMPTTDQLKFRYCLKPFICLNNRDSLVLKLLFMQINRQTDGQTLVRKLKSAMTGNSLPALLIKLTPTHSPRAACLKEKMIRRWFNLREADAQRLYRHARWMEGHNNVKTIRSAIFGGRSMFRRIVSFVLVVHIDTAIGF